MPVTSDIHELFRKWGIDPDQHRQLIHDLMKYVYDEKIEAVTECTRQIARQLT